MGEHRLTLARRQWGFDFPTRLVGVRELTLDGRHFFRPPLRRATAFPVMPLQLRIELGHALSHR